MGTSLAMLSMAAFHTAEGAQGLQVGGTVQASHPILMIVANCLGILLVLGCCALIFSSSSRTPGKR